MKIGGLQKTSLLDYPDRISAIVWTVGCNLRCPFCYNTQLVYEKTGLIPEEELFDFLNHRKGKIEAVVLTGGEPLLHKDIVEFSSKIKQLGYLVKVDTNGTFPDRLKHLLEEGLADYIAMDIKAPKQKYDTLAGVNVEISKIDESINLIKKYALDYEFKTTIVPGLLDKEDIIDIARWLKGAKKFYLQQFKSDTPVISSDLQQISPYKNSYLEEIIHQITPYFSFCSVRGV